MARCRSRSGQSNLAMGLVLVTVGAALLLERLGVIRDGEIWHWWPGILVVFGLQHVLRSGESRRLGRGITLIGLGAVFFLINFRAYGLNWDNGWPLILVAVGLGIVGGALDGQDVEVHDGTK